MSGPQLTAWAASAVALVAVVGVAVLLVQVRRLRAAVSAPLVPPVDAESDPRTVAAAPVVELVPVRADEAVPTPVPTPVPTLVATHGQLAAATLSHRLVRVAALSYGIRRALRAENRDRVRSLVRRDVRRRHKVRRRSARRAARVVPLRSAPPTSREESAS